MSRSLPVAKNPDLQTLGINDRKREFNISGNSTDVHRMFTALAASNTMIVREMRDCSIIKALAQRERTCVSVGDNAVLVLKERKR